MLKFNDIEALLSLPCASAHHDDGGGHHATTEKPSYLPAVAKRIWPFVAGLATGAHSVDAMMKLYRLQAGAGTVPPHQDKDYQGKNGMWARHSIIIFLNEDYEGGETLFEGVRLKARPEVGGGLLFPHQLLHEGRAVIRGTKFVLKTDLFTLPR
jgi:hypothetical protein